MRTLLLIFAIACTAIGQTTKCPGPYHAIGTGCYAFPDVGSSWISASALCQFSGGYLVNIESDAELSDLSDYIFDNFPSDLFHWIGATDVVNNGTWRWVPSGATVVYEKWGPEQPQNYDCSFWFTYYENDWHTENCCTTYSDVKPLCEADPL